MSEFEYIMSVSEDLEAGQWIAVIGKKIVSKGDDGNAVFCEAKRKYPTREPFIMKVPSDSVMLM